MPILFADKSKRFVAAIHCGRRGLEKKIIKNLIEILEKKGSSRNDLLVAIGPSISKDHYLVDKNTFKEFYKNIYIKKLNSDEKNNENFLKKNKFKKLGTSHLAQIDLREIAHMQLLDENIPIKNIDISNLCTYNSKYEFYSFRRTKTLKRQWSFISPYFATN